MHEFVILSVFAAHLTENLNSRSPIYSILHLVRRNKQGQQWSLFVVSQPANQPTSSCREMQQCRVYRCVWVQWRVITLGDGGAGRPLFVVLNLSCSSAQKMDYITVP